LCLELPSFWRAKEPVEEGIRTFIPEDAALAGRVSGDGRESPALRAIFETLCFASSFRWKSIGPGRETTHAGRMAATEGDI